MEEVAFCAAFKPTPSIAAEQRTVNKSGEEIGISTRDAASDFPAESGCRRDDGGICGGGYAAGGMTARLDLDSGVLPEVRECK